MKKVQGVIQTGAGAYIGEHQFEGKEVPTVFTGWDNGTDYSSKSVSPLTWEAAEQLYKDLAKIFEERAAG